MAGTVCSGLLVVQESRLHCCTDVEAVNALGHQLVFTSVKAFV